MLFRPKYNGSKSTGRFYAAVKIITYMANFGKYIKEKIKCIVNSEDKIAFYWLENR